MTATDTKRGRPARCRLAAFAARGCGAASLVGARLALAPTAGPAAAWWWSAPASRASSPPTGCAGRGTTSGCSRRGAGWAAGSTPGAAGPARRWTSARPGSTATPRATRSRRSRTGRARGWCPRRTTPAGCTSTRGCGPRRAAAQHPLGPDRRGGGGRAQPRPHDESLAEAVRRRVAGLGLSAFDRDELAFHLNAHYTTEWGADPDELSARTVDEGKEYGPTGEDAFFPDGYDRVRGLPGPAPERRARGRRTARGAAPRAASGSRPARGDRRPRGGGDGPARGAQARRDRVRARASPNGTARRSTGWAWGC